MDARQVDNMDDATFWRWATARYFVPALRAMSQVSTLIPALTTPTRKPKKGKKR